MCVCVCVFVCVCVCLSRTAVIWFKEYCFWARAAGGGSGSIPNWGEIPNKFMGWMLIHIVRILGSYGLVEAISVLKNTTPGWLQSWHSSLLYWLDDYSYMYCVKRTWDHQSIDRFQIAALNNWLIAVLLVSRSGLVEDGTVQVFYYYGFHSSSSFLM